MASSFGCSHDFGNDDLIKVFTNFSPMWFAKWTHLKWIGFSSQPTRIIQHICKISFIVFIFAEVLIENDTHCWSNQLKSSRTSIELPFHWIKNCPTFSFEIFPVNQQSISFFPNTLRIYNSLFVFFLFRFWRVLFHFITARAITLATITKSCICVIHCYSWLLLWTFTSWLQRFTRGRDLAFIFRTWWFFRTIIFFLLFHFL